MKYGPLLVFPAVAGIALSIGVPDQVGLPGPAALAGCFADDCTPVGDNVFAEQGHMIDENTWESSPVDGTWKEFRGAEFIYFHGDFQGRQPYDWSIYVSVSANPVQDNNVYTEAAGNIATVNMWGPNQIAVTNGTCARYFIRVVLRAPPAAPASIDAGADAGDADADAEDPDATLPDAAD